MEDRRAHERLTSLEEKLKEHLESHARFESAINDIAENTTELVQLVKGAKGLRSFVIWVAPVIAAIVAVWAWIKGH